MSYLKLFRVVNLLIIALMMYFTRFFIIEPAFMVDKSTIPVNEWQFLLLVFTFLLISAGGYAVNDYFDAGMDEINRKEKRVLNNTLPLKAGRNSFYFLTAAGILTGIILAFWLKSSKLAFMPFFIAALYWFYSTKYKREFLIGNISVAFLAFCGVGIVWIYYVMAGLSIKSLPVAAFNDMNKLVLFFAFFAFLATFIREIVKDIVDVEGDKAFECVNLPIKLGEKKAKNVAMITGILLWVMLALFIILLYLSGQKMIAYFMGGIMLPFNIYWLLELRKAKEKSQFVTVSNLLKMFMVMGILSMSLYYWQ